MPRGARELIGWLGLEPHAHERCEGFSRGMRQKVALAGALVHDPKLIILDEPLTGLDAGTARQVKDVLRARVREGGTVIMTTHILEVAERMADRIGVIARGRLIAEGTLDDLRRQTGETATSLEDTLLTLVPVESRRRLFGHELRIGNAQPLTANEYADQKQIENVGADPGCESGCVIAEVIVEQPCEPAAERHAAAAE